MVKEMADRGYNILLLVVVAACSFIMGVSVGDWAARKVLEDPQKKFLHQRSIVPDSELCSYDGKIWWPAREVDGLCYAEDAPHDAVPPRPAGNGGVR